VSAAMVAPDRKYSLTLCESGWYAIFAGFEAEVVE
jgi:hypothetical protein